MPELPEVETVVKAINKSIESKTINELNIINNKLRWPIDNQLSVNGTTEKLKIGSKADSDIPVTDLNKLLKIYVQQQSL